MSKKELKETKLRVLEELDRLMAFAPENREMGKWDAEESPVIPFTIAKTHMKLKFHRHSLAEIRKRIKRLNLEAFQ